MKYLKIAFGLAMVAGLMAAMTSSAIAAPIWVHCEKVTSGKWTNSLCTTAGSGEWETKAVTETSEVTSSTEPGSKGLELEDKKAGTAITCVGVGTGTVGANGSDSVKTIKAEKCKIVAGKAGSCEEPVTARALNLGWSTKLEEKNGELRDAVTSLISGKTPGYAVECEVDGILKITDECTGNITTNVVANRANGTVETTFDSVSEGELGNCTVGGEKEGRVAGKVINKLRSGAYWALAAAIKT
jgi:hypothetical protein